MNEGGFGAPDAASQVHPMQRQNRVHHAKLALGVADLAGFGIIG